MGIHPRDLIPGTPALRGHGGLKVLTLFEEFQAGEKRGETVGNG